MNFARIVRRGQEGFSFLDILMGVLLLGISFVGLAAYSGGQRKALYKANDVTEASTVAVTAMQKANVPLSDSANFRNKWNQLSGPVATTTKITGTKTTYTAVTTLSRVANADNLIRIQVRLDWPGGHRYNIGMVAVQP